MIDTSSEIYQDYLSERYARYDYLKLHNLPRNFRYYDSNDVNWGKYKINKFVLGKEFTQEQWKECSRVHNACLQRKKILKNRINLMMSYKVYFITLTFTDEVLNSTNKESRRKYVLRLFKSLGCVHYIACREYGSRTSREHYHAIIAMDNELTGYWKKLKYRTVLKDSEIEKIWEYGLVDVVQIDSEIGNQKVSRYLAKTSGYISKDTNKSEHLIYSRTFKNIDENKRIDTFLFDDVLLLNECPFINENTEVKIV